MTRPLIRTMTVIFASAALLPAAAAAQTFAFGSASPAVAGPDTTTAKPAAPAAKPAADSTKPEFKPSWNFSAWLFGTWTYQTDSATKAVNKNNAATRFTVDRAYLTFRGQVTPDFGFRVTTDVKTLPANAIYNGLIIRLKYAYMQWDYLHAAEANDMSAWARIGQIHTVVIDEEERVWARWIQKTAIEYWAIQPSSADEGASTQLTLPNKWGWAYFTVGNGGGYETAVDADRYKDVALRFSLTPLAKSTGLLKTLEITPWAQIGRSQGGVVTNPGLLNNAGGIFVDNGDPRLSFGVEYAERQVQTLPAAVKITTTATLWDAYVITRPALFSDPKGTPWGLILRYDKFKASNSSSLNRTLLLAGVFLDVAKNSSFALTYQDDAPHSLTSPTTAATAQKTYWELNWQVTF